MGSAGRPDPGDQMTRERETTGQTTRQTKKASLGMQIDSRNVRNSILRMASHLQLLPTWILLIVRQIVGIPRKFMDLSEQILGIPRKFVDLSEQIHEIVRKILGITRKLMDLSEQILGIPRKFVDLSEQIHEIQATSLPAAARPFNPLAKVRPRSAPEVPLLLMHAREERKKERKKERKAEGGRGRGRPTRAEREGRQERKRNTWHVQRRTGLEFEVLAAQNEEAAERTPGTAPRKRRRGREKEEREGKQRPKTPRGAPHQEKDATKIQPQDMAKNRPKKTRSAKKTSFPGEKNDRSTRKIEAKQ